MAYRHEESLIGIVPRGHLTLYITGLISMLLGLALIVTSIYILPYLIFNVSYPLPDVVITFKDWVLSRGENVGALVMTAIITPPILIAVGLFYLASTVTGKLETYTLQRLHDHEGEEAETTETNLPKNELQLFTLKVALAIASLLGILVFIEIFVLGGI